MDREGTLGRVYPTLGDTVIYCDNPGEKGDPVGKDKAAIIVAMDGDGENATLHVFNSTGGACTKYHVPHHEPEGGDLPKIETYRLKS